MLFGSRVLIRSAGACLAGASLGLFVAATASAQPVTHPEPNPILAQIRDDKQLSEALSSIAQDPAVHVDDASARPLAQALMTEGVRQLQTKAYDQALANFLEAYNKLPSPKILLNIASTLRDMGRPADAANTYQRYLTDPTTGAERVAEVKELLLRLDEQLTIITVRVFPKGSDISVDGGPFIPVGSSLVTRVRPGIHLVRIRTNSGSNEFTINGFEGENKDVSAIVNNDTTEPDKNPKLPTNLPPDKHPKTLGDKLPIETQAPDKVEGWLITGTQYGADSASGRERRVRTGYAGPELAPIVPKFETTDSGQTIVHYDSDETIGSGFVTIVRIDGKGRGFAGGAGIAYAATDRIEIELAGLKSDVWGAYVGARYRFLTGWLRPYAGGGVPTFFCTDNDMKSRVAPGFRAAAGVELMINGHFSVQGDLGYEHFFNVDNTPYDPDVFVPTIGLILRR